MTENTQGISTGPVINSNRKWCMYGGKSCKQPLYHNYLTEFKSLVGCDNHACRAEAKCTGNGLVSSKYAFCCRQVCDFKGCTTLASDRRTDGTFRCIAHLDEIRCCRCNAFVLDKDGFPMFITSRYEKKLCQKCTCRTPSCEQPVIGSDGMCTFHSKTTCRRTWCSNPRDTGDYCSTHTCSIDGCLGEKYADSSKCSNHLCMFYSISKEIPGRYSYYERFCCRDRMGESKRCERHVCPECRLPEIDHKDSSPDNYNEDRSVYCKHHECRYTDRNGRNKCYDKVVAGRITCYIHSCIEPTCMNGSRCWTHRCKDCKIMYKSRQSGRCEKCSSANT